MSKLDHAASLTSSDAASTRKATLQQCTTNRKSINTGYDALFLRRKVASPAQSNEYRVVLPTSIGRPLLPITVVPCAAMCICGSDMHFGEIVENWATRYPKERALAQRLRAFGRPRRNTGQNLSKRRFCDSRSFEKLFSSVAWRSEKRLKRQTHSLLEGNQQLRKRMAFYRMIQPECSVEELRELAAVPPHIERGSASEPLSPRRILSTLRSKQFGKRSESTASS
jgi:hypothetical protein